MISFFSFFYQPVCIKLQQPTLPISLYLSFLIFQENYERMQILVDQLKCRTEKIKLGRCECMMDYSLN